MNEIDDVLTAVNDALSVLLKRRSNLYYESQVDVDRHDDSISSVEEDIKMFREVREKLEERLSK